MKQAMKRIKPLLLVVVLLSISVIPAIANTQNATSPERLVEEALVQQLQAEETAFLERAMENFEIHSNLLEDVTQNEAIQPFGLGEGSEFEPFAFREDSGFEPFIFDEEMLEIDVLEDELILPVEGSISIAGNAENLLPATIGGVYMPINPQTITENAIEAMTEGEAISPMAFNNHNPNSALFIDSGLFNQWIVFPSGVQQDWFMFAADANTKVTISLQQPPGTLYPLLLYRLVGNTLSLVSSSVYTTNLFNQQFSYIPEQAGIYFLSVFPLVPAFDVYRFIIHKATNFDSGEADDNVLDANVFNHAINVNNRTLTSSLDVDWFEINTGNEPRHVITLENIPPGQAYAFRLLDSNLNSIGSVISEDSRTVAATLEPNSTYFIQVFVFSGTGSSQPYRLEVVGRNQAARETPGGNWVHLEGSTLIIDNRLRVDLHRLVRDNGNISARTPITGGLPSTTWGSAIIPYIGNNRMQFGSRIETGRHQGVGVNFNLQPVNISSNNAVRIFIGYFSHWEMVSTVGPSGGGGIPPQIPSRSTPIPGFGYGYIVVDGAFGSLLDHNLAATYWFLGFPRNFTLIPSIQW